MQFSTAQHSTAQHSSLQSLVMALWSIVLLCPAAWQQLPTAQHSTAQHSTAQHSTAQHSAQDTLKYCLTKQKFATPVQPHLPLGGRLGHANPAGLKPPLLAVDSCAASFTPSSCSGRPSSLFLLSPVGASLSGCCGLALLLPVVLPADLPRLDAAREDLLDLATVFLWSGPSSVSPRCGCLCVGSCCIRSSNLDDTACSRHSAAA